MRPERDFTPPSAFCPHPELWTAIDALSAEREVTELVASLVRALQPEYVLATGAAYGYTAQAIGEALRRNGHGRLAALEHDEARAVEAEERCAGLPVKVLQEHALRFVPEEPVCFAWLDGAPEERAAELRRFLPWMASGTLVAVHDTAPHVAIHDSVQALVKEGSVRSVRLRTPRGLSLLEVIADGIHSAH